MESSRSDNRLPFTLGWEASGVVIQAPHESKFAVGQTVVSLSFGVYAERFVANPLLTFPLPKNFSHEEGAAFPLNYLTALAGLDFRGALRRDESLLVLGAAGGVGSAAIQVGKALGASVTALVSNESKAVLAMEAGADDFVLSDPGWNETLKSQRRTFDMVFDPVGGDLSENALRTLSSRGRLIVIGFASGRIPTLALNRLLLRNTDVRGCSWSVLSERAGGFESAGTQLGQWAEAGAIVPKIGEKYAFENLMDALSALDERRAIGKQVLLADIR